MATDMSTEAESQASNIVNRIINNILKWFSRLGKNLLGLFTGGVRNAANSSRAVGRRKNDVELSGKGYEMTLEETAYTSQELDKAGIDHNFSFIIDGKVIGPKSRLYVSANRDFNKLRDLMLNGGYINGIENRLSDLSSDVIKQNADFGKNLGVYRGRFSEATVNKMLSMSYDDVVALRNKLGPSGAGGTRSERNLMRLIEVTGYKDYMHGKEEQCFLLRASAAYYETNEVRQLVMHPLANRDERYLRMKTAILRLHDNVHNRIDGLKIVKERFKIVAVANQVLSGKENASDILNRLDNMSLSEFQNLQASKNPSAEDRELLDVINEIDNICISTDAGIESFEGFLSMKEDNPNALIYDEDKDPDMFTTLDNAKSLDENIDRRIADLENCEFNKRMDGKADDIENDMMSIDELTDLAVTGQKSIMGEDSFDTMNEVDTENREKINEILGKYKWHPTDLGDVTVPYSHQARDAAGNIIEDIDGYQESQVENEKPIVLSIHCADHDKESVDVAKGDARAKTCRSRSERARGNALSPEDIEEKVNETSELVTYFGNVSSKEAFKTNEPMVRIKVDRDNLDIVNRNMKGSKDQYISRPSRDKDGTYVCTMHAKAFADLANRTLQTDKDTGVTSRALAIICGSVDNGGSQYDLDYLNARTPIQEKEAYFDGIVERDPVTYLAAASQALSEQRDDLNPDAKMTIGKPGDSNQYVFEFQSGRKNVYSESEDDLQALNEERLMNSSVHQETKAAFDERTSRLTPTTIDDIKQRSLSQQKAKSRSYSKEYANGKDFSVDRDGQCSIHGFDRTVYCMICTHDKGSNVYKPVENIDFVRIDRDSAFTIPPRIVRDHDDSDLVLIPVEEETENGKKSLEELNGGLYAGSAESNSINSRNANDAIILDMSQRSASQDDEKPLKLNPEKGKGSDDKNDRDLDLTDIL